MKIEVNRESKIPLYQQLATQIEQAIQNEEFQDGERLPAEAKLAVQTNLSQGTVKAAYSYLREKGYLRKVRGGGAYITREPQETFPKEPEEIVDEMFRKLGIGNQPMSELYALAQQNMVQTFRGDRKVCAALIDCNAETLHEMTTVLEKIKYLTVEPYLVDDLLTGKEVISVNCNLALTSRKHFSEIAHYADSLHLPIEELVMRESRATIARLTILPEDQPICILYRSKQFLKSVQHTLSILNKNNELICGCESNYGEEVEQYSRKGIPFIVPPDYLEYSDAQTLRIVARARKCGSMVIPFSFEVDGGSILHLEQSIKEIYLRGGLMIL